MLSANRLGTLSLSAGVRANIFYEQDVMSDVPLTSDEFQLGISTGQWDGNTDTASVPVFFWRRPEYSLLNIDVRHRKRVNYLYRDQPIKDTPLAAGYNIKVYMLVVQKDEEIEKLPEHERTAAYDRAIRDYLRSPAGKATGLGEL